MVSKNEPINETYSFELVSKCTAKRNIQFQNNVAGCQTDVQNKQTSVAKVLLKTRVVCRH